MAEKAEGLMRSRKRADSIGARANSKSNFAHRSRIYVSNLTYLNSASFCLQYGRDHICCINQFFVIQRREALTCHPEARSAEGSQEIPRCARNDSSCHPEARSDEGTHGDSSLRSE